MIGAGIYGIVLGMVDLLLEARLSRELPIGLRIILKSMVYSIVLIVVMVLVTNTMRMVVGREWAEHHGLLSDTKARTAFLWVMAPFALVGNVLMSTFKQIDLTFGPGILPSLLMGRYRRPVLERRIFMFMDLRSSTHYAEQLGHSRYSAMIRDLFAGMDQAVREFDAEIYQYVGDEVVFTWNAQAGVRDQRCLLFFFAIEGTIRAASDHYFREYGLVPQFKAGMHLGEVTAVEIGTLKREIAYHGDTINTAARIQGLCNEYGRNMLVSEEVVRACGELAGTPLEGVRLGAVMLRGRTAPMTIHAITRRDRP